ncbi:MAG TPA: hypothetical protein VFB60_22550 [Ktedonobacteraceae bacterium]|nr:hypothetical protein [Ktedonobacteraceae bacterium]
MQLHDTLQVCLLALASRYPEHTVDINEIVLGHQKWGAEGWTSEGIIDLFEKTCPVLLQEMARLFIDIQRCEIYLPKYAERVPAFLIHCRGKIPCCQGDVTARKEILVTGGVQV